MHLGKRCFLHHHHSGCLPSKTWAKKWATLTYSNCEPVIMMVSFNCHNVQSPGKRVSMWDCLHWVGPWIWLGEWLLWDNPDQCRWHHSLVKSLGLYNSEEVKPSRSRKVSVCNCGCDMTSCLKSLPWLPHNGGPETGVVSWSKPFFFFFFCLNARAHTSGSIPPWLKSEKSGLFLFL